MSTSNNLISCLKKKQTVTFDVKIRNIDTEIYVTKNYDEVFVNDEEFSGDKSVQNQLMIVDIGCPRSLMGNKEYKKLLSSLSSSELRNIKEFKANEKFRFGPSRSYKSLLKIEIPFNLEGVTVEAKFFVVDGEVPILIGNDILEPLGAVIYTETGVLEFSKLGAEIVMKKTRGGHFVIPVKNVMHDVESESEEEKVVKNNVLGNEADAVMLVMFAECDDNEQF